MAIKKGFLLLLAVSASYSDIGFSFHADPLNQKVFRAAVLLPKKDDYGVYSDMTSLSVMTIDGGAKISLNPVVQFLLFGPVAFVLPPDLAEKFQYPFWLTNFRVQGNTTRHSFVYFKQVTDLFTDGVYSESSVGVGLKIKKFELYGGGAKAVLDPFGLPNEITWRLGVSKWL